MNNPLNHLSPGEAILGYVQVEGEEKQTAVYFYEDRVEGESASASTVEVRTGITVVDGVVLIPIMICFPFLQSDYIYECWLDAVGHDQHLRNLKAQKVLPVRCYDKFRISIPYSVNNILPSIIATKAEEYVSSHEGWSESQADYARKVVYDKHPTPQDLFKRLHNCANSDRWSF